MAMTAMSAAQSSAKPGRTRQKRHARVPTAMPLFSSHYACGALRAPAYAAQCTNVSVTASGPLGRPSRLSNPARLSCCSGAALAVP